VRTISLSKTGLNKLKSGHRELKVADLEDSVKSLPPGEWCFLVAPREAQRFLAFVNPLIDERFSSIQILSAGGEEDFKDFRPEAFIATKLKAAFELRLRFKGYEQGSRIFYGAKDGLPGLIIDMFTDVVMIQINTAGVDRYRDFIAKTIGELTDKSPHLLDNPTYRGKEFLPTFETTPLSASLGVRENDLSFEIRPTVVQKVGFYYDHRENRLLLRSLLERRRGSVAKGVDLFCYVGAWGLNALTAGVKEVVFVDQGDFAPEIEGGLERNGLHSRGRYLRKDVFRFLDEAIAAQEHFDLVISDPPAFTKSLSQKKHAIEGYQKLHRRVLKIAAPGALLCFSSCTHYVTPEEFQKTILDAAAREGRRLSLLGSGLQGWDHPVESTFERSSYIKSLFYILEN
jgi:23S rRNA (cytosine1962-C5)-methyltransferase